ncbi:DnaJ-like cysteine-rich domain-containing protein [Paenibacillus albiflavus]|uniref:hypothetical protein n=1 Tax=Paenibacillus albiflavus TaxID=2545760 RepID=UPI00140554D0|nr:hypothetical protein [Paenibacillus albiflavus]
MDCYDCLGNGDSMCSACSGTGEDAGGHKCLKCRGHGVVECSRCNGSGHLEVVEVN